jgi:TonB-linked SusC/RagA family outer membrane protein
MVGSVSTISAADIELRPVTSVGAVLFGAAPGLMSTTGTGTPGDDPSIRIRGFGTINASSSPLIIVDGAEYGLSLRTINPNDIESLSVLRDASATAIYGSRGANGVILITTRRGSRDRTSISVNLQQGFSSRFIPEQPQASPQDYYQLMFEAHRNSLYFGPISMSMATANQLAALGGDFRGVTYTGIFEQLGSFNPFYGIDNNEIIDPITGRLNPATTRLKWGDDLDWFGPMSRLGTRTDFSLSASGGSAKGTHFLSLNYLDDNAWMERSFTRRLSARANVRFEPKPWLRLGTNISGSMVNSYNQAWSGDGTTNPFFTARIIGSIYPVYLRDPITGAPILDANGNKIFDVGGQEIDGFVFPRRPAASGNRNIVAELLLDDAQYTRITMQARPHIDILFLNGFTLTLSANLTYSPYSGYNYRSNLIGSQAMASDPTDRGFLSRSERLNFSENYQQLLSYNRTFGKHELNIVTGHESFRASLERTDISRSGQIMNGNHTKLTNFLTLTEAVNDRITEFEHRTEGYLFRTNYSYDKGRLNLEVSFRRDGSSRFHRDVRWDNFWSIGGGWTLSREDFIRDITWVNNLRLRASYGTNGNLQGISNYAWQDIFRVHNNNMDEPGYVMNPVAANPRLTWESMEQLSIGLEYAVLQSRIRGSIEFFNKVNDGLIFNVRQPASSGMTTQTQNVGRLYNRGIEIDVLGEVVRSRDFNWSVGVSAATLRNRITRMPEDNPELIRSNQKLKVGQSIYDWWLRDWYGVDPRDGMPVFRLDPERNWNENTSRIMADGTEVTTDLGSALFYYAGTSIPDLYGTINTNARYKAFNLSLRLGYQIGGLAYDENYLRLTQAGRFGYAIHADMVNRWQQPGDITDMPRMDNSNHSVFTTTSTRYLINASHLFLNSATFSYTLPRQLLEKMKLTSVVLSMSGENLFLTSARKGFNPMESFSGHTSYQFSPSRVITFGVNLTL